MDEERVTDPSISTNCLGSSEQGISVVSGEGAPVGHNRSLKIPQAVNTAKASGASFSFPTNGSEGVPIVSGEGAPVGHNRSLKIPQAVNTTKKFGASLAFTGARRGHSQLYTALLEISRFSKPEDLATLNKKWFLELCGVDQIHWELRGDFCDSALTKEAFKKPSSRKALEADLIWENLKYGTLFFISAGAFSKRKKTFLKKVADQVAFFIYSMEGAKQTEVLKNQWDMVFDSFYRPLCLSDENFLMLRTNKAFRQLTGRKKTEIAGRNVFSALPFPVTPPALNGEGKTWVAERKVGDPLSLEFSVQTVRIQNERLTLRLILVRDITEEVKMERKISRQARSRELGFIKSGIAHELNNPIAGMKALLTVIEMGLEKSSARPLLNEMSRAVSRCGEIVSRLLSASRNPDLPDAGTETHISAE